MNDYQEKMKDWAVKGISTKDNGCLDDESIYEDSSLINTFECVAIKFGQKIDVSKWGD